jgi:hypothetical protein
MWRRYLKRVKTEYGVLQGLLTKNPHKVGPYFFIQFWILDFDKITKVYGKV